MLTGKSINDPEESAPAEGTGYAYLNGDTLTLSNFNYTSPSATAISIEYHNCTINKMGESTVASTNDDMVSHTITAVKTLTLTGAGTLNVIAGEAVNESAALWAENVTVNEGTLNVIGGTATKGDSYGISIICYSTLKVSGGTVNAIGGTSTYESHGVNGPGGGVIVSDNGILNANGGSCGVTAGQVTVSAGGTLVSLGRIIGNDDHGNILPDFAPTVQENCNILYQHQENDDWTMQGNVTIPAGQTLTINEDETLTIPDGSTLTNNGTLTIADGGILINSGTLTVSKDATVTINKGVGYTVNYAEETVTPQNGFEISKDNSTWGTSTLSVAPGEKLYVRLGTSGTAVENTMPAAPEAPVGLVGVNETFVGESDGKITGTTDAMEYKLSTDTVWISCETEPENLVPGTYDVRYKSTDTAFVGKSTAITIESGMEKTYTLNVDAPTFDAVTKGYEQPAAKTIIITSTGNSNATIESVTVNDTKKFTVSGSDTTVTAGGTLETYTIQPAVGLDKGTYTATITVTYNNGATAEDTVTFTVNGINVVVGELTGSAITSDLINAGFDTVDSVKEKLLQEAVKESGYTADNSVIYDAELTISTDGGLTWVPATAANFPADGKVNVVIPYPAGTNKTNFDFVVVHMFATNANGKTPGTTETPTVTKADDGLHVTLTGLSPVSVSWKTTFSGGSSSGGSSSGGSSYTYYTITASADKGGSISPNGSVSVRKNEDKTFTITPDSGYVVSDVLVDGKSVGAVKSYTFEDISEKHSIKATFALADEHTNPQTGDSSNMSLWIILAFFFMFGIAGAIFGKKRLSEKNDR